MPNTVQFHRVLRATPERVYRAFLDSDAMVKWLPPNGFTGNGPRSGVDRRHGIHSRDGLADLVGPVAQW